MLPYPNEASVNYPQFANYLAASQHPRLLGSKTLLLIFGFLCVENVNIRKPVMKILKPYPMLSDLIFKVNSSSQSTKIPLPRLFGIRKA